MSEIQNKSAYRQKFREIISKISSHELSETTIALNLHLGNFLQSKLPLNNQAVAFLSYSPHFLGEIDLSATWKDLKSPAPIFIPKVLENFGMEFYQNSDKLSPGSFGIYEPEKINKFVATDFQTVIALIPGLGFDLAGNRLGRGLGFYDRFLYDFPQSVKLIKIGIALKIQVIKSLPQESHDQKMDFLLTETGLISLTPLI